MRSDLDAIRERHVRREIDMELRAPSGDWGWARVHGSVGSARPYEGSRGRPDQITLDAPRPGTEDGGF